MKDTGYGMLFFHVLNTMYACVVSFFYNLLCPSQIPLADMNLSLGPFYCDSATWYDDNPAMTVHYGSCGYGYLGNKFGGEKNWMVSASFVRKESTDNGQIETVDSI